uniref:Uncharacterized protein n=1 Tax=Anas platyrhynchos platyrhynchos TaxID=8840 RepID=A0A493TN91_ANAPP
ATNSCAGLGKNLLKLSGAAGHCQREHQAPRACSKVPLDQTSCGAWGSSSLLCHHPACHHLVCHHPMCHHPMCHHPLCHHLVCHHPACHHLVCHHPVCHHPMCHHPLCHHPMCHHPMCHHPACNLPVCPHRCRPAATLRSAGADPSLPPPGTLAQSPDLSSHFPRVITLPETLSLL